MTMTNYITLDGKKYVTVHPKWKPQLVRPKTVRVTLAGDLDATFGSAVTQTWMGIAKAPITPKDASWGTRDDMVATFAKASLLTFVDHRGDSYNVAILSDGVEMSRSPDWDVASNTYHFVLTLIGEA